MEYVLLFAETPAERGRRDTPDAPAYWGAWTAYMAALQEAGVMRGGAGLLPPEAGATLRLRGAERLVQAGPFADSQEQLGGYVLLDAPDLDVALEWAARAPCAGAGAVEIRPILPAGG
jgi:hypothetical protein